MLTAAHAFHRRYEAALARRHGRAAVDQLRDLLVAMAATDGNGALDPRLRALSI